MANSRLERLGTIFTRVTGLLRAGAMKPEDKPLWYDLYAAFPPAYEPKYSRPAPNMEVKNIFYPEDEVRALLHRRCGSSLATISLSDQGPAPPVVRQLAEALDAEPDAEQQEQLVQGAVAQLVVRRRFDADAVPSWPSRSGPGPGPSSLAADFTASQSVAGSPKLGISVSQLLLEKQEEEKEKEKGGKEGSG